MEGLREENGRGGARIVWCVCDVAYGMDDLECVWCKYACLRKWDNGGGGAGILWRCDFAIAMCGKHSIPSSSSSFRVDLHALQVS
jgi:hypothetical protein